MSNAFAEIAFTPAVKAAQQLDGSRAAYARNFERGDEILNQRLGDDEADFIAGNAASTWPRCPKPAGPMCSTAAARAGS